MPFRVAEGAAWNYYFTISGLTCVRHATEVRVTIAGKTVSIACSHRDAFASGPLAPSQSYSARSQAAELRGRRIVKLGPPVTVPLEMPGAGDSWIPVANLPGTPPG